MRIAAIGDIHVGLTDQGRYKPLFMEVSKEADILCICGDLTQQGGVDEASVLKEELTNLSIPCFMVLGNHDCESNQQVAIIHTLTTERAVILDGTSKIIDNVGFAGIKGFIGGFGSHVLPFWGEKLIKDVVQEGTNDALKLERALSLLETKKESCPYALLSN